MSWTDELERRMRAIPVSENSGAKEAAIQRALGATQPEPSRRKPVSKKVRLTIVGVLVIAATAASPVGPALAEWIDGVAGSDSDSRLDVHALTEQDLEDRGLSQAQIDALRAREDVGLVKADSVIPPGPVAEDLLGYCREILEESPQDIACRAVVARDEGTLAPGEYTSEQLEAALGE